MGGVHYFLRYTRFEGLRFKGLVLRVYHEIANDFGFGLPVLGCRFWADLRRTLKYAHRSNCTGRAEDLQDADWVDMKRLRVKSFIARSARAVIVRNRGKGCL